MQTLKIGAIVALLLCASSAQAGVYRCSGRGGIYYSDKGCRPGDTPAPSSGKGSVSIIGGGAPPRGGYAGATAPQTQNRYTRRAEAGAARADQALGNK